MLADLALSDVTETSHLPVIAGIGPSLYIELPAIVVGALSGGAHAVRKGFDVVGVIALALAAGLGGGIIRDLLLGRAPPLALSHQSYLVTTLFSAVAAFFFSGVIARMQSVLGLIDSAALGFFGTAGAQEALERDLPIGAVILVGTMTAVGGSIVRDLLANDVPVLLVPGQLYATVAGIGVIVYVIVASIVPSPRMWAEASAIGVTLALRTVARRKNWQAPRPRIPLREPSEPP